MNLEQRVTALEQELQILKNQVQATLLDIREQLLNNTYPSLQEENSTPGQGPSVSQAASRPPDSQSVNVRPVEPSRQEESRPQVRQVSLKDLQAPDPADDEFEDIAPRAYAASRPAQPDNGAGRCYEEDEMETRPTRHHIPENGRRSDPPAYRTAPDNYRQAPPEFLASHGFGMPPLPFLTEGDDAPPFITQTELISEADWASLALLESWAEQKVAQIGTKRTKDLIRAYASEGRFDAKMKDALLQLVTIIDSEDERAQAAASAQEPPVSSRASKRAAPAQASSESDPLSQHLILKLIAGVQNAGTKNGRRKNHG